MPQMTHDETRAAIAAAEKKYRDTCDANRSRLLLPVQKEISRLNAAARQTKDKRVKSLNAWLDVLATQPATVEGDSDANH